MNLPHSGFVPKGSSGVTPATQLNVI
uniref:Uncharacterized protein n=1 Tax=Moniliophthora roreri TaxID=221103 RepID=A0A0W0G029_MONRR